MTGSVETGSVGTGSVGTEPGSPADRRGDRLSLFSLSTCVHCRAAKKVLGDLGEPFETLELDLLPEPLREETLAELALYNPAQTFPTLVAGSRVAAGPRPEDIRRTALRFISRQRRSCRRRRWRG